MRPPGIGAEVKSAGFRMIFEDFSNKNEKKLLCLLSIFHRVVRENPGGRTDFFPPPCKYQKHRIIFFYSSYLRASKQENTWIICHRFDGMYLLLSVHILYLCGHYCYVHYPLPSRFFAKAAVEDTCSMIYCDQATAGAGNSLFSLCIFLY